jgi:DNA-3-methyladenine glycosylase II
MVDRNRAGGSPAAPLTELDFRAAVADLAARDEDLAAILARYGQPPFWARPAGFGTLIHVILEQQVSLASAKAAYDRLQALLGEVTPAAFVMLEDEALRALGFSRQKMRYGRSLAQAILAGELDLDALQTLEDGAVRGVLQATPGIGPWTAEVYLLMALRRPDVWPVGDLGLLVALYEVKDLPARPSREEAEVLGEPWRPWRAVATRILWHHYLSSRRSK